MWQADRYTAAAERRSITDVTHQRWWGWWVENRDSDKQFVTRSLHGCLDKMEHEKQVSACSSINIVLAAVTLLAKRVRIWLQLPSPLLLLLFFCFFFKLIYEGLLDLLCLRWCLVLPIVPWRGRKMSWVDGGTVRCSSMNIYLKSRQDAQLSSTVLCCLMRLIAIHVKSPNQKNVLITPMDYAHEGCTIH